jgi:hypothetical protein
MRPDNTVSVICYVVGAAGPCALLIMALRYSESSRWIRLLFFVWALAGIAWATLGFILLFYWQQLTHQQRFILDHLKTHVAGVSVGLLISALLTPDFWKISRHYRNTSWLRSILEV